MPTRRFKRFLAPRPRQGGSSRPDPGRNFVVVRETWRITDDPATDRPRESVLIASRSAAEAADCGFSRHGFHSDAVFWPMAS